MKNDNLFEIDINGKTSLYRTIEPVDLEFKEDGEKDEIKAFIHLTAAHGIESNREAALTHRWHAHRDRRARDQVLLSALNSVAVTVCVSQRDLSNDQKEELLDELTCSALALINQPNDSGYSLFSRLQQKISGILRRMNRVTELDHDHEMLSLNEALEDFSEIGKHFPYWDVPCGRDDFSHVDAQKLMEYIHQHSDILSPVERNVLGKRLEGRKLEQIGKEQGFTRQRAKDAQKKCEKKFADLMAGEDEKVTREYGEFKAILLPRIERQDLTELDIYMLYRKDYPLVRKHVARLHAEGKLRWRQKGGASIAEKMLDPKTWRASF